MQKLLFNLLLSLAILVACAAPKPRTPMQKAIMPSQTPVQPMEVILPIGDGGFLSKQPCGPPCFMRITPGISKETDVLEFLQNKINLSSCDKCDTRDTGGTKGVRCDNVEFTFQDTDIVNGIGFKPNKKISLKEVVAAYGNPDSLFVVWELDNMGKIKWVQMNLYYDSIYARLDLPNQENSIYEISPDAIIDNISFFDRSTYEHSKIGTKPWVGYGEYPASSLP